MDDLPADLSVPRTLLITLTGRDRPGVTSSVFATLASYGVEVVDIEQIVLRGRLIGRSGGGGVRIETAIGPVLCEAPAGLGDMAPGAVLIRPEHVVLAPAGDGEPGPNRFHGTVSQTAFLGEAVESIVQVAAVNILVRSAAGPPGGAGPVELYFPPERTLAIAAGDP